MLMPIGDDNSGRRSTPYVVYTIVALNILVFVFLQQLGSQGGDPFTYGYSVVPYEITRGVDLQQPVAVTADGEILGASPRGAEGRANVIPQFPGPAPIWLTLISAMFMHGGFMHIIGNMLYLWVFGDNVEDNFGHVKFAVFYLVCGLVASFAQIFTDPTSPIPNLGASGAIAGVLGSYIVLFPKNRVHALLPLGIIWTTVEIPAYVSLGLWILLQFVSQYTASADKAQGGVAYMAHIGGFVAGLVLVFLFRTGRTDDRGKTYYRPY